MKAVLFMLMGSHFLPVTKHLRDVMDVTNEKQARHEEILECFKN
jgi:hypothetical protein